MKKVTRTADIIESKNYRKISYNIVFDGKGYYLLRVNSTGIPEVMTYHETIKEARTVFHKLFEKNPNSTV